MAALELERVGFTFVAGPAVLAVGHIFAGRWRISKVVGAALMPAVA